MKLLKKVLPKFVLGVVIALFIIFSGLELLIRTIIAQDNLFVKTHDVLGVWFIPNALYHFTASETCDGWQRSGTIK